MYHELTTADIRRRRRRRVIAAVLVALVVLAIIIGFFAVREATRAQSAAALRESILTAARQCCAVEGSYPSSLAHLEDVYGLTINHDDYIITYEWFADNVMPSVVVIPR